VTSSLTQHGHPSGINKLSTSDSQRECTSPISVVSQCKLVSVEMVMRTALWTRVAWE